jgi:hypothetical protein
MFRITWPKVLLIVLIVSAVFMANAGLHFVGSVRVSSGSLIVAADIAGFGNNTDTVTVTLTATGTGLTALCQNRGGNIAPGRNPVNVNVSASQIVSADRNGRASAEFYIPFLPSPRDAGCPNGNWRVVDLQGTLHVNLFAFNSSNGDSDSLDFTCNIDGSLNSIECSQV